VAHILLIDDDDDLRLAITTMLETEGYQVNQATNGAEGIQKFLDQPADLIITDIIMPGQDGIATLLEMRADHPNLPIIVISGEAAEYLDLAKQFGATAVLPKPFRRAALLEAVAKALS